MYKIRPLAKADYYNNFLQVLNQLSMCYVDKISYEDFCRKIDTMYKSSFTFVIEDQDLCKIIACGTLLIEHKFIHNLSCVGHIEDIVVDAKYRNKGLGKQIIEHLVKEAKDHNCYKVILNCSPDNIKFYEKCGFACKNMEMSIYFS